MPDDYVMKAIPKQMIDLAENEQGQQFLDRIADNQAAGEQDDDVSRAILR